MTTPIFNGCSTIKTEVRGHAVFFSEYHIDSFSGYSDDPKVVVGRIGCRALGFRDELCGISNIESFKANPEQAVADYVERVLQIWEEPDADE